jgi:hypothetical protein
VYLILKNHDRRFWITMGAETVGATHSHIAVVVAIQIDDVLSPLNPSGIAGDRDDILEYDIVSQDVKVVLAFGKTIEPFSNDVKEGSIGSEV